MKPWLDGPAADVFLTDHWQRAACFMPGALPNPPPAPDWRALAADEQVESRRILTARDAGFSVTDGPFPNDGSDPDPTPPWTVLIRHLDTHVPAVRGFLDTLPFLPRWRLDDIMMSVAVDGGSVGPHVDRYDVFLIQIEGQRHWQVGKRHAGVPDPEHASLRLVHPFQPETEHLAQPGDVLYLPPDVPHHGVARGHCVTYSIGFRAPRLQDIASLVLAELPDDPLLGDAGRRASQDIHAIDKPTLRRLADQLKDLFDDEEALAHALGELVTEPIEWDDDAGEDIENGWRPAHPLLCNPTVRLAHFDRRWLYANGVRFALSSDADVALAATLCTHRRVDASLAQNACKLARELLAEGIVWEKTT
ncbi:MAG: cupin domain-containing protein [Pseudomonadota bacterium]